MNKRYVLQVLVATFGFGMLLAVIAALQTPADRPIDRTGASRILVESPQCHHADPAAAAPSVTPQPDDSKKDCEFLSDL